MLLGRAAQLSVCRWWQPQCDFQDYEAIVKFWIDTLADQDNFNVVVALHPSVKIDTMRHIKAANVHIAARRTSELVRCATSMLPHHHDHAPSPAASL